jgi:hypothetical protein
MTRAPQPAIANPHAGTAGPIPQENRHAQDQHPHAQEQLPAPGTAAGGDALAATPGGGAAPGGFGVDRARLGAQGPIPRADAVVRAGACVAGDDYPRLGSGAVGADPEEGRLKLAGRAADSVAGEAVADRVLDAIARGASDPDALARGIGRALLIDGTPAVPGDGLRAFARRVQKTIEEARHVR